MTRGGKNDQYWHEQFVIHIITEPIASVIVKKQFGYHIV
jgi:hypothetical protein